MKQPAARYPGLDTLRVAAIVAVMLFHLQDVLPESFERVAHFGWMGVDLFFVLSGYLIGSQLLRPYATGRQPSLREFYRRRLYRILPAYLFVLLLYFAWPAWREAQGISPAWEFLTFSENLFVDYARNHAFSHVWSLCVEEHFYLVFPLLVLGMMRRPSLRRTVAVLAGFVAVGIASRWYVLVRDLRPLGDDFGLAYIEHIYYPTWTRLDGLLAGVTLALVRAFRPAWWRALASRGHLLLIAGLALFGLSLWLLDDRFASTTGVAAWGTVVGFPVLSFALALIVASSISDNGLLGRLRVPGARAVATLSFSLYLVHKEIVHLDQTWLPALTASRDARAAAIYLASCMAAAAVLYLGVERPFLLLRDRGRHRRDATLHEQPGQPFPPALR